MQKPNKAWPSFSRCFCPTVSILKGRPRCALSTSSFRCLRKAGVEDRKGINRKCPSESVCIYIYDYICLFHDVFKKNRRHRPYIPSRSQSTGRQAGRHFSGCRNCSLGPFHEFARRTQWAKAVAKMLSKILVWERRKGTRQQRQTKRRSHRQTRRQVGT